MKIISKNITYDQVWELYKYLGSYKCRVCWEDYEELLIKLTKHGNYYDYTHKYLKDCKINKINLINLYYNLNKIKQKYKL